MRVQLLLFTLLATLAAASCARRVPAAPNVLIIVADDLGWGDVSFHGSNIRTPNIDRLASEGVEFTQLYANPLCTPSRAALMTGRYPMRYGLQEYVIWSTSRYGLPLSERTLAEEMKERGYRTALCGKWHLGQFEPGYRPEARGFDHYYGNYGASVDYFEHVENGALDWWRNGEPVQEPGYATDLVAAEAVRWIGSSASEQPWFLTVAFQAPHTPLQVPDEYMPGPSRFGDENERLYAGMVENFDAAVGRILQAVDERGEAGRTLVLFASDNGATGDHGSSNDPYRGEKGGPYEGSLRVLGLARWKGVLPAGKRVDGLAHLVDFFPTAASRSTGAELPDELDGVDLWPLLTGRGPAPREEVLLVMNSTTEALRRGRWKLICHYRANERADGPYTASLFDLESDPSETINLVDRRPALAKELGQSLNSYFAQSVAPIFSWK